ncbi:hypothetical protein BJX63DRAFT_411405 [Aspergillus granulosus]|uniref:Uncharacterized protein n=1 Tax=Aspergillus granulosus TaxID=176169 RepID=A0ABR4GWX5_9EURO
MAPQGSATHTERTIAAKYPGGVTQEVAVQEAIESMKPFNVEFKEVHWRTSYTIAKKFSIHDRIFPVRRRSPY